jgi:hypothetical protein
MARTLADWANARVIETDAVAWRLRLTLTDMSRFRLRQ